VSLSRLMPRGESRGGLALGARKHRSRIAQSLRRKRWVASVFVNLHFVQLACRRAVRAFEGGRARSGRELVNFKRKRPLSSSPHRLIYYLAGQIKGQGSDGGLRPVFLEISRCNMDLRNRIVVLSSLGTVDL
jgi:hypothetical protein